MSLISVLILRLLGRRRATAARSGGATTPPASSARDIRGGSRALPFPDRTCHLLAPVSRQRRRDDRTIASERCLGTFDSRSTGRSTAEEARSLVVTERRRALSIRRGRAASSSGADLARSAQGGCGAVA